RGRRNCWRYKYDSRSRVAHDCGSVRGDLAGPGLLGFAVLVSVYGLRRAEPVSVGVHQLVSDDDVPSQSWPPRIGLASIVLVESRSGLLEVRQEILEFLGHPIIAVAGRAAAKALDLACASPSVIVIGHRAPREKREDLIRHFRSTVARVPILPLI